MSATTRKRSSTELYNPENALDKEKQLLEEIWITLKAYKKSLEEDYAGRSSYYGSNGTLSPVYVSSRKYKPCRFRFKNNMTQIKIENGNGVFIMWGHGFTSYGTLRLSFKLAYDQMNVKIESFLTYPFDGQILKSVVKRADIRNEEDYDVFLKNFEALRVSYL